MQGAAQIVFLDAVGSTNDHAKMLARAGAIEGTVVTAERQTHGRGRQGNSWLSEPGNLFMTVILRPQVTAAQSGQLSFLTAVALADAVRAFVPQSVDIALKWPNDMLLNGKKAAGILLETEAQAGKPVDWVILGLGVNIAHGPENAVHLKALGADDVTVAGLLDAVHKNIMALYAVWQESGFEPIRQAWLGYAAFIGQEINVRLPTETFRATFLGIDAAGALQVTMPDGSTKLIASGEVYTG
jgi:BirA family transcriptional regulator, biotin operon repressor / biotin---[acetyl-CoA-carboxylase] ligase